MSKNVEQDVAFIRALTELLRESELTEIEARIGDNYALARTLGLQGTPSFILGNQIIRGFLPLDRMQAAVAEARAATN